MSGLTDLSRLCDESGNYWQSYEGCVITETHGDLFYSCTCTDDPFGASTINLSKEDVSRPFPKPPLRAYLGSCRPQVPSPCR